LSNLQIALAICKIREIKIRQGIVLDKNLCNLWL
jgi:hypothetical protein